MIRGRYPYLVIDNTKVINFFSRHITRQKELINQKLKIQQQMKDLRQLDHVISLQIGIIEKALIKAEKLAEKLKIKNLNNGVENGKENNNNKPE